MFNQNTNQNTVSFTIISEQYKLNFQKSIDETNLQNLFLLSKFCENIFFEIMPKPFTISTKDSSCHFNLDMLKETSPVISNFIQSHPNEMEYHININDEEKVLTKFEQLYQGKIVHFTEDELPTSQRITRNLQIKNCPFYLKPNSLCEASELRGYYNNRRFNQGPNNNNDNDILLKGVELNLYNFINFLRKTDFQTFNINTKNKHYKCNSIGIYSSTVIRQILENDPKIDAFNYDFDDENDEFQLICDFFNFNEVSIKSDNMDLLKKFAEDLKIDCILQQIDKCINNYEKVTQKIDEQQTIIDSIDDLFDLLYNIELFGIEKVKISILQSKWIKDESNIEELAAFILQVIKPSFSLQKEMVQLLFELNKESNDTNKLSLLMPLIIDKLMNFYMPKNQASKLKRYHIFHLSAKSPGQTVIAPTVTETINYTNKFVYSFIRLLYKKNIIPKEVILEKLKNYDCFNDQINIYFLPEIIEINPKNIYLLTKKNFNSQNHCNFQLKDTFKKYLPDKIDLYEKMLDNMEPDDELTKSLRRDDVDMLQIIINTNGIDISKSYVPYNVFDDIEENVSLINYAALYGSLKCFKFLFLNKASIDFSTFYFAVYGGNNEIIKIVDQNQNESINIPNDICFSENSVNLISFWFISNLVNGNRNTISRDKFDDLSIQYSRNVNNQNIVFLNCLNINNIIAPTIAMHNNKLFDWIFENKFVLKSKNGIALVLIAELSALTGNSHSLIEIIDNGFDLTAKSATNIISYSAKNGFYKLTQLLLNLFDQKTKEVDNKSNDNFSSFDYNSTVHFGSLSIFKLFIKQMNQKELEHAISHAISMDHMNIVNYFFDHLSELNISHFTEHFITNALNLSFSKKTDDLFNFFIDQFKKFNPEVFKFDLFTGLLNDACLNSNLSVIETITELILKEDPKYDFSSAFIKATSTNGISICQYFIDKKVFINYEKLSSQVSKLGSIDLEFFELILKNVNQYTKYKFYKCIDNAIISKNKKLVEFLFKINPPNGTELIEAVYTHDVEIVDLVLKYNSKPFFINQKTTNGTAITIAAYNGDLEIVKRLLLIPGIDIYIDICNRNPLIDAILSNDIEIVDTILNFIGDDYSPKTNEFFEKALNTIYNIFQDNNTHTKDEWNIVKRLCQVKSFDPNYCSLDENFECNTFLYTACSENEYDVVEFLLNLEKIDVNKSDYGCYFTPLMIAIDKKNVKIAKLLLKHPKTNINWNNVYNETALVIAVKNELIEIIDLLIKDDRFDAFESRLNISFIYSNIEIAKLLCSLKSLDVNMGFYKINLNDYLHRNIINFIKDEDKKEINALIHSVEINDVDKIDLILNHPSFDKYKSDINSAIFASIKDNNIDIFRTLFQLIDNDINIINENGESLLEFAAINLSGAIVEEIFNNPNFDPKNDQIYFAFVQSFIQAQEKLNENRNNNRRNFFRNQFNPVWQTQQAVLNQGLIPDKISLIETMTNLLNYDNEHEHLIKFNKLLPNGKSFFTMIDKNYDDINNISTLFINNGVDVNMPDKNGIYPLEYAIKIDSIDLVNSLINSEKIVFSNVTKNGSNYLHLAAANDNPNILSIILNKNVIDINSENNFGETPLFAACKANSIENINLLFQNDNLDYLHRNKDGKDSLDIIRSLPQNEADEAKQSKENYKMKIISIINEKKST